MLKKTVKFETLLKLGCFMFFQKDCRKSLKFQITLSLVEAGPSFDQNLVCSDKLGQNIWNKVAQSIKIRHDR